MCIIGSRRKLNYERNHQTARGSLQGTPEAVTKRWTLRSARCDQNSQTERVAAESRIFAHRRRRSGCWTRQGGSAEHSGRIQNHQNFGRGGWADKPGQPWPDESVCRNFERFGGKETG